MTEQEKIELVARALAKEVWGDEKMGSAFTRQAERAIAILRPIIRSETLEEAAVIADESRAYDADMLREPDNDAEDRAAFERGEFKAKLIATTLRALQTKFV